MARQVDLGDVARDHHLAGKAHAGQEHLHLFAGGVLRLVEDDEGVVKSPTSHKCQRGHLDHTAGQVRLKLLLVEHVSQRVV